MWNAADRYLNDFVFLDGYGLGGLSQWIVSFIQV